MTGRSRKLADLIRQARDHLARQGIASAELDARLLVEWATGCDRLAMVREPNRQADMAEVERIDRAVERRIAGESVHRIMGWREFFGMEFELSADTLEPRPDTEALVELALGWLTLRAGRNGNAVVVDLGTGTGAIALALLQHVPGLQAIGVDISAGALTTARGNAKRAGLSARFAAIQSDWFARISGSFDMIISNPPYIVSAEIPGLQKEVSIHDPARALDGGADGLDAYRKIAQGASRHLAEEGRVALEIGAGQRADVERIFAEAGFVLDGLRHDLGGHERALLFARAKK
jgi:release factor glutamine methyltransferase